MKIASDNRDYEKAIHIRDTLSRLQNLLHHQKMENNSFEVTNPRNILDFWMMRIKKIACYDTNEQKWGNQ